MELPWQSRKLDDIFPAEAGKVIQTPTELAHDAMD